MYGQSMGGIHLDKIANGYLVSLPIDLRVRPSGPVYVRNDGSGLRQYIGRNCG